MIIIKNVEDFEAERERQFKAWIKAGKEEDEFFISLEGADLEGAKISDTIITQSQYDELKKMYSNEFMDRFVVKEL